MVEWNPTGWVNVVITIMGCTYSLGQVVLGGLAFALRDWRTLSLTLSIPFFAVLCPFLSLFSCLTSLWPSQLVSLACSSLYPTHTALGPLGAPDPASLMMG